MNREMPQFLQNVQNKFLYITSIIWIEALVFIITATVVYVKYQAFNTFLKVYHYIAIDGLLFVGSLLLICAFFGVLSSIRKSRLILNIYILLLFVSLVLDLVVACMALVTRCSIYGEVENSMNKTLENYKYQNDIKVDWDIIQENFRCCGFLGPLDWQLQNIEGPSYTLDNVTFTVPYSCCQSSNCDEIYTQDCLDKVTTYFTNYAYVITITAFVTFMIQILILIYICILANILKNGINQLNSHGLLSQNPLYEASTSRSIEDNPPNLHTSTDEAEA